MKKQPNILFIMADDHASKALSSYDGGINYAPILTASLMRECVLTIVMLRTQFVLQVVHP